VPLESLHLTITFPFERLLFRMMRQIPAAVVVASHLSRDRRGRTIKRPRYVPQRLSSHPQNLNRDPLLLTRERRSLLGEIAGDHQGNEFAL
jgi:hypothetical protein